MPELFPPGEVLVRIAVMFPYIPAGIIAFRRLLPRLPLSSKLVAISFFLAQTLVIGLSLVIRPTSHLETWFWHISREWNLLSGIASLQLILVTGLVLYASWLIPRRLKLYRRYLVGVGLLFLFIALDETFAIHEEFTILFLIYALIGPFLLVASAFVYAKTLRRFRIWLIILMTGLSISGLAEIILEQFHRMRLCGSVGPIFLSKCLEPDYLEEALGFLGIWLALVAVLGHLSEMQGSSRPRVLPVALAILALWIAILYQASPVRIAHPPDWATPALVVSESGPEIVGYQLDENGQKAFFVAYFPNGVALAELGYSIHMIDMATQNSVASFDEHFDKKYKVSKSKHDFKPLYLQTPELITPLNLPANRAFRIVLTLWRERDGEFQREKILSSDLPLLGEAQVILGEWVIPKEPTALPNTLLATFDTGFVLEAADLPDRVIAGDPAADHFRLARQPGG